MRRILKYFKPFSLLLVAAIALLFIQANADLALPDYMADIVNVGIQQGGVNSPLPEAISQTAFERAGIFMTAEEKSDILAHYTLIDANSSDYETYLGVYPSLADGPVYVLQTVDADTRDSLERIFSRPLLMVFGLEQASQNPELAAQMFPHGGFDLSKLPPGMDIFDAMKMMPAPQKAQISTALDERFSALGGEKAIRQAASRAVLAEYESLGMDTAVIQRNYILRVGGFMLLIALISAAATITVGLLSARIAAGLARDLRRVLYERVMHFSGAEFSRFSTASLITRSTNDITQIQTVTTMLVRLMFFAPIIGVGAILRALDKSPSMWWIIVLAVVILLSLIGTIFTIAVPKFKLIQKLIDRLNLVARENLVGMMVVRAFGREKHEEKRFDAANIDLTETSLFVNRVFVVILPFMMLIMNGATMLTIWVGAHEVAQAQMQVGDMMAFMQYAMPVVFAFMMLSMLFIMFPRADVSANRIADVLETPITILDPEEPKHFPTSFHPTVEFRGVASRYPEAEDDVLHNITFKVEAGQTVGIMGTTGSGKSTVVDLIPRFFDVTDGQILIDGVDIRDVSLSELRSKIGYVPQTSNLFTGTVESNLRFADDEADEETLRLALGIAQAGDFVFSKPEEMQAEVSQGGINFSGGQKQRLTIARALVKKAPIYIFDDSFSALDYQTDARLRRALLKQLGDSTVFIVSQRVATIKNADKILVLDQGRLIGEGTHQELMQSCEVYREIALSQLKQEALA
ncbi:MAG: ABC transporter ATP-binding protein/permease [Anaerolineales bacterium]|nr:ABC transporter ATP-binding protein/permease [Anaerolineales bacterium]